MDFGKKKYLLKNTGLLSLSREERRDVLLNCEIDDDNTIHRTINDINKEVISSLTTQRPQLKGTAKRLKVKYPTTYPIILKKYPDEKDRKVFLNLHWETQNLFRRFDTKIFQIIIDLFSLQTLTEQNYNNRYTIERVVRTMNPYFSVEVFHNIFGKEHAMDSDIYYESLFFRFSGETLSRLYLILGEDINDGGEKRNFHYLESAAAEKAFEIGIRLVKTRQEYQDLINSLVHSRFRRGEEKEIALFLRGAKNFGDFSDKLNNLKENIGNTIALSEHSKNNSAIHHLVSGRTIINKNILRDIISRNKKSIDIFYDRESTTSLKALLGVSAEVYLFITAHIAFKSVEEILNFNWNDLADIHLCSGIVSFCESIEIPKKDNLDTYFSHMRILGKYNHISDYPEAFSSCNTLQEVINTIDKGAGTFEEFFKLSEVDKEILTELGDHNYGRNLFYSNPGIFETFKSARSHNLLELLRLTETDHIKGLERLLSIGGISSFLDTLDGGDQMTALHKKYSYNVFLQLLEDPLIQKAAQNLPIELFEIILRMNIKGKDLVEFLSQNEFLLTSPVDSHKVSRMNPNVLQELVQHKDTFALLRDRNSRNLYDSILKHSKREDGTRMSLTEALDKIIEDKISQSAANKTDTDTRKRHILKVNIQQVADCKKYDVEIEGDELTRTLVLYYREENMDSGQYLTLLRTAFHYIEGGYSKIFNRVAFVSRIGGQPLALQEIYPGIKTHDVSGDDFKKLCNHFANTAHLTHSSAIEENYMQESTHIIGVANTRDGSRARVPENGNSITLPILFTSRESYRDNEEAYKKSFDIKEISHLFWDSLVACEEKMLERLYI